MSLPKGTFNKQNIAEQFAVLMKFLISELSDFSLGIRFGWQTYKPEHAATCVLMQKTYLKKNPSQNLNTLYFSDYYQ